MHEKLGSDHADKAESGHGGLVITRKAGEAVFIGDDVEIIVVRIEGDKARLQIKAPLNVRILRKELLNRAPLEIPETPLSK